MLITKSFKSIAWVISMSILIWGCKTNLFNSESKKLVTQFKVSNNTIELGDSVILSWKAEKAERISIQGIADNLKESGQITVKPDTSIVNYKLIVERKGEKPLKKMATVQTYVPTIISFDAPDSVSDESEVVVTWNVKNCNDIQVVGIKDSLPPFGSLHVKIKKSQTFKLIAKGKYNSVEKSKEVKIWFLENIAGSNTIFRGMPANLNWKFKNTKYVEIKGIKKQFSPIDTLIISPDSTRKFVVNAIRNNGQVKVFEMVVEVKSPFLEKFTATATVMKGEPAVISWQVAGVKEVYFNGDTVSPRGVRKENLSHNKTYTLIYYDGKKPVINKMTVKVLNSRPFLNSIDTNKTLVKGQRIDCDIIAVERDKYPNEVKLRVLVVDTMGNYISNLAPPYIKANAAKLYFKNLVETIDGKEYPVSYEVKEVREEISKPYDISLTLDYSGSMYGTNSFLEKAARIFINSKYTNDRISVTKFDNRLVTENPLFSDQKVIMDSARFDGMVRYGQSTALYAGTDEGLRSIKASTNNKVMVLFTDGCENSSFQYFGHRAFNANQIAAKARQEGIKLFIISYGDETNYKLLWNLANLSGGKHYHIDRPQDISKVFIELPRTFRYYYEITYKPRNVDGPHYIRLDYNNMNGGTSNTNALMQIGEKYDLNKFEYDSTSYWIDSTSHLKPLTTPQAVAFFKFDDSHIDEKYFENLNKYIEFLNTNLKSEILIIGHTDSKGGRLYCKQLSLKRAKELEEYLISKGISKTRIRTEGRGKENLIWNPDNDEIKSKENRRIEVVLFE